MHAKILLTVYAKFWSWAPHAYLAWFWYWLSHTSVLYRLIVIYWEMRTLKIKRFRIWICKVTVDLLDIHLCVFICNIIFVFTTLHFNLLITCLWFWDEILLSEQFFCMNCKSLHQRMKGTKTHEFQSSENVVPEVKLKCEVHKEDFIFRCDNCEISVCVQCVTGKHKGHRVSSINEFISDLKVDLLDIHLCVFICNIIFVFTTLHFNLLITCLWFWDEILLSLCPVFSFDHCTVCHFLTYGFWFPFGM
jgi:hypothetical protein